MVSMETTLKKFADARGVFYANPIFRVPRPALEGDNTAEWTELRKFFAAAFNGEFDRLDGLLDFFHNARGYATRDGAVTLIGDACTDRQLEAVEAYVLDSSPLERDCALCESLAIWGRLSAAKTILTIYDRYGLCQDAEGLPAYLTTMLEPKWGPAADYPQTDTLEEFLAYEARVNAVYAEVLAKVGDERLPVAFGEVFGVRQLVERYLEHLGPSPYEKMMRPFFRRRFEASTGIDCSDFYVDRDFLPIVASARLEAWLDSPEADRYEPGVRYFFGRRIPSST